MNRLVPNNRMPMRFWTTLVGSQPAPPVGHLFGTRDNSVMPKPRTRAPARQSAEVETVRLFTASGHPWMGLAALAMWRIRWSPVLLATMFYAKHVIW